MNTTLNSGKWLVLCSLTLGGCSGMATKTYVQPGVVVKPTQNTVCMLPSEPALSHRVIGTLKTTKKTYGGVDEAERALADAGRMIGANAVFNVKAEQRFKGPLPWRAVAPTGIGKAVFVEQSFNCFELGGTEL